MGSSGTKSTAEGSSDHTPQMSRAAESNKSSLAASGAAAGGTATTVSSGSSEESTAMATGASVGGGRQSSYTHTEQLGTPAPAAAAAATSSTMTSTTLTSFDYSIPGEACHWHTHLHCPTPQPHVHRSLPTQAHRHTHSHLPCHAHAAIWKHSAEISQRTLCSKDTSSIIQSDGGRQRPTWQAPSIAHHIYPANHLLCSFHIPRRGCFAASAFPVDWHFGKGRPS